MSPESDQKGTSSSSHQLQISPEVPRLTKRNLRESHSLGVDSMDTGWHPPFFSFRQMFGPRALFKGLPRIGPGANGIQTKPTKSPKWDKSFTFQYLSIPFNTSLRDHLKLETQSAIGERCLHTKNPCLPWIMENMERELHKAGPYQSWAQ